MSDLVGRETEEGRPNFEGVVVLVDQGNGSRLVKNGKKSQSQRAVDDAATSIAGWKKRTEKRDAAAAEHAAAAILAEYGRPLGRGREKIVLKGLNANGIASPSHQTGKFVDDGKGEKRREGNDKKEAKK